MGVCTGTGSGRGRENSYCARQARNTFPGTICKANGKERQTRAAPSVIAKQKTLRHTDTKNAHCYPPTVSHPLTTISYSSTPVVALYHQRGTLHNPCP